jgi:hypothetical protein
MKFFGRIINDFKFQFYAIKKAPEINPEAFFSIPAYSFLEHFCSPANESVSSCQSHSQFPEILILTSDF